MYHYQDSDMINSLIAGLPTKPYMRCRRIAKPQALHLGGRIVASASVVPDGRRKHHCLSGHSECCMAGCANPSSLSIGKECDFSQAKLEGTSADSSVSAVGGLYGVLIAHARGRYTVLQQLDIEMVASARRMHHPAYHQLHGHGGSHAAVDPCRAGVNPRPYVAAPSIR